MRNKDGETSFHIAKDWAANEVVLMLLKEAAKKAGHKVMDLESKPFPGMDTRDKAEKQKKTWQRPLSKRRKTVTWET